MSDWPWDTASELLNKWHAYVDTFQVFNRDWDDKQQLSKAQIETAENSRRRFLTELENLHLQLILRMSGEVLAARDTVSICPP